MAGLLAGILADVLALVVGHVPTAQAITEEAQHADLADDPAARQQDRIGTAARAVAP